jgi:C-terminal processing protease CtpA/Prc
MDKIIGKLRSCNSMIIDIRNNTGGTDSSALAVANHFIKKNLCYQISRTRKSNYNYSYGKPKFWHTHSDSEAFINPVIVLINRYTMSAAESFSLALKSQSHVTFLGEPTAGAFSDSEDAYLPNGWHFTYSVGVWTDGNQVLWEEKGIQPDIGMTDCSGDNKNSDPYIEQALKILAYPHDADAPGSARVCP